jgi:hypothetical protein
MPKMKPRSRPTIPTPFVALAVSLIALSMGPAAASALTIDFEEFVHGQVVTSVEGATITVENFHRAFDYAVAFDTEQSGTRDSDLEADWVRDNLGGDVLGNILIIQEDATGCDSPQSVCAFPDDEGGRTPNGAGTLTLDLDVATPTIQFVLVDIDDVLAEAGALTLWDAQGDSVVVDFMTVLAGLSIGDNTAFRVDPLVAADLGIGDIVKAEFRMGGSGGIDEIEVVPEPTTALLMGLGLMGLGLSGHRRTVHRT